METNEYKLLKLLPLLQQVFGKVGVHRTKTGRDAGLTNMLINAIGIIHENEKCTMRMLAKELLIAPPAATRIVNDLIKKKMVRRETDPSDRRLVRLRITPHASEIFYNVHVEAAEILARVLARLNEEEQDALIFGLEGFVRAVLDVEREDQVQSRSSEE
ncbi:MAG TPA: MarR family transcriptional regulator [Candidatus Lokiarchaeia archaeon]|nr:MarR family transcriptional regulator [Candidatus Lokiarchaeia archaeon]